MKLSKEQLHQFYAPASKWACRGLFVLTSTLMTYVATRDSYNFAHWLPHRFLKEVGVPYQFVLWGEQNADVALHFFGAMILTFLIFGSKLSFFKSRPLAIFILVSTLCIGAEFFQFMIGRGIESSDLLLGILGSFMAYWGLIKKHKTSLKLSFKC
ncbi:MAG: VanZ family protein [Arenicella sp.]|jgi:VanZ family protein